MLPDEISKPSKFIFLYNILARYARNEGAKIKNKNSCNKMKVANKIKTLIKLKKY